jgi:hypothetical protein
LQTSTWHAQAIDALALFFDERLPGYAPDDSCGEAQIALILENSSR